MAGLSLQREGRPGRYLSNMVASVFATQLFSYSPPPPVGNFILLEDNTSDFLLEDNTSQLLLEA